MTWSFTTISVPFLQNFPQSAINDFWWKIPMTGFCTCTLFMNLYIYNMEVLGMYYKLTSKSLDLSSFGKAFGFKSSKVWWPNSSFLDKERLQESLSFKMIYSDSGNLSLLHELFSEMPVTVVKISWNDSKFAENWFLLFFCTGLNCELFPEIRKFHENWHLCPSPPPLISVDHNFVLTTYAWLWVLCYS